MENIFRLWTDKFHLTSKLVLIAKWYGRRINLPLEQRTDTLILWRTGPEAIHVLWLIDTESCWLAPSESQSKLFSFSLALFGLHHTAVLQHGILFALQQPGFCLLSNTSVNSLSGGWGEFRGKGLMQEFKHTCPNRLMAIIPRTAASLRNIVDDDKLWSTSTCKCVSVSVCLSVCN